MTRAQFRKARVQANREYGTPYTDDEVPGITAARSLLGRPWDILQHRMSGFTPDARSRIAVYPLIRKEGK